MINKFLTDIHKIKDAINTKKLVVFAGAGISIDAGVPSWNKLIEEIKKELDLPENEEDFLKIPQIYYNERQQKEYVEKVRDVLKHKKLKHNEIHEEIFELKPEHVLTTNFEDLLEQVINKKSLPFSIVKEDRDLPYSYNTKLLVKIHGDLDSSNFVLKEDDYLNYSYNHPLIEAFIKSIFATKVVLFIGYSYNDYNLKQIVQNVRNILGNNFQNAYFLSIDNQIHHSQKSYLKNKGINVIDYHDANYVDVKGKSVNYILEFLKGKNIYKEKYYQEIDSLSDKGQLLYNFLRFIRFYDELKKIINEENVVNQLYNSFDRFSELKSLPQNFVAKLYPFKSTIKPEHLIEQTTLLLKNKVLANLFYNEIAIEDSSVIYTPVEELSERERKAREKKLKAIITKLNNSLFFSITKENAGQDSLGYKGFSKDAKNINIHSNAICQCSKCKFERFQYKDCIIDLNSYSINEISDIKEDIQKAYLNYKIGNYLISFKMYEEIATKAWQLDKYLTYYIAKSNMKSLKWLIDYEDGIDDETKEKIISQISDIDTDKLISEIPYKSNDEYTLLKIIRDDTVLIDARNKIDEIYRKIEEAYISYQSKYYYQVGPYYPHLIYIEIYKIIYFYTNNYIVADVFSNFKTVINKGIEGLILSYATSKEYGGRLKDFSHDFFWICVSYCKTSELVKFLENHKVKTLEFESNDIPKILDYCENFFNSFFNSTKLFFGNTYKNDTIFNQLSKDAFEGSSQSVFSNMMLLLLSIEIPEERRPNFIKTLITFLEYENFIHGDGIKYLNRFIERNPHYFTLENCQQLLKILIGKIKKHEMYNTIETIAYVVNENKFDLIIAEDFAFKILSDFDYYEPRNKIIVPLWQMSNDEVKTKLKEELIKRLNKKFDEELYRIASSENMISYDLYFDEYIKYLNSLNAGNREDSIGYTYSDGRPKFNDFRFYNAIWFLYHMDVKATDARLQKLVNLTDYMKFFIFRGKSDLTNFKLEWLELMNRKIIFKEISRIKPLKKIIEDHLKINFNEKVAEIYTKYFIGAQTK